MDIKEYLDINKAKEDLTAKDERLEKINESIVGNYKRPSITISQNHKFLYISVEMNELSREDINLIVSHMSLDVIGEKKKSNLKNSSYKGYRASIALPTNVNMDEIGAEFVNGKLNIIISKIKTKLGTKIDIK